MEVQSTNLPQYNPSLSMLPESPHRLAKNFHLLPDLDLPLVSDSDSYPRRVAGPAHLPLPRR